MIDWLNKLGIEWVESSKESIEASSIKAYTYMDEDLSYSTELTHSYTNKLGKELKCYIIKYDDVAHGFIVCNENGVNAFIKRENLKQVTT